MFDLFNEEIYIFYKTFNFHLFCDSWGSFAVLLLSQIKVMSNLRQKERNFVSLLLNSVQNYFFHDKGI